MNVLIDAASAVQRVLVDAAIDFCFIGGFAAQRHAEPRVTRDVDLAVLTGLGNETHVIDVLLAAFPARRADARAFAERYRVLLLQTASGVGIDATLTALPFEAEMIARSTPFEFAAGVYLRTCSAEDLLIMKIFAGRPIDWRDVEMVLRRYRPENLDLAGVKRAVAPLLAAKDDTESMAEFERLLTRVARAQS
jgi:hypothetical protein